MSIDVYPTLTKAIDAMGPCRCGHQAIEHWHGGPATDPEVKDCGVRGCRCRKFKRTARREEKAVEHERD